MAKKKTIKEPPYAEAEQCFQLRCRSKRGEYLSPEHRAFCEQMFEQYPAWYCKLENRVFNATMPFGSKAYQPE